MTQTGPEAVSGPALETRCPACSGAVGGDDAFCPHCGALLRPEAAVARADVAGPLTAARSVAVRRQPSRFHRALRVLLVAWFVAYWVVSFGPMIVGIIVGGDPGSMAAVTGVILGGVLFIPWLIGLALLGLLAWLSR